MISRLDISKPDLPRRGALHSPLTELSTPHSTSPQLTSNFPSSTAKAQTTQVILFIVARWTIPVSSSFEWSNRDPTLLRTPCDLHPIPVGKPCTPLNPQFLDLHILISPIKNAIASLQKRFAICASSSLPQVTTNNSFLKKLATLSGDDIKSDATCLPFGSLLRIYPPYQHQQFLLHSSLTAHRTAFASSPHHSLQHPRR